MYSNKTRFAIQMFQTLRENSDMVVSLVNIETNPPVSLSYKEQLMGKLIAYEENKFGICSKRGPGGGYAFLDGMSESNIQILDVIDAVEPKDPDENIDLIVAESLEGITVADVLRGI